MPPCQMRHQFAAQELRVRAGYKDVYLLSEEAVDKQLPSVDVLNFIQEQILEVTV